MTRRASSRAGIAVSALAIEEVRGSLNLVRTVMILLIVSALLEVVFLLLDGFSVIAISSVLVITGYVYGAIVMVLAAIIWLLVAVAAIRLRTVGARGFARRLDAIVCAVLVIKLVLVAVWFRGMLEVFTHLGLLFPPMDFSIWRAGAVMLLALAVSLVLLGPRLDDGVPGLRTAGILIVAALAGWWIGDLAWRERVSGRNVVLLQQVEYWAAGVLPLVLVAVLAALVHRINARLQGRLCSRRMFRWTLVVASVFAAGWWLERLGLWMLVPVAPRGWLTVVFDVVRPLFVLAFAVWMLVAVRHAGRRLMSTGTCLGCGYDLKGIDATRCPECGREVAPGPL